MKLPVVKIPDPILRKKAQNVKKITPELVNLAQDMLETMEANNGIGLAAPQIGQSIRLFVARLLPEKDTKDAETVPETILFNPQITQKSKSRSKLIEGCLSIPKLTGVIERPSAISVTGLNEKGKKITIAAEGLYARVIQHEIDHLDGILFTDRLQKYDVVFYGTSEFAVPPLEALIAHPQFNVVAVVTETDKPAGRGHAVTQSPVKAFALNHRIHVLQPQSLNIEHKDAVKADEAAKAIREIENLNADFQIVASYGKILPQNVLDLPRFMSINIHPSLLPNYRGATPIQSTLMHGDTETGIAIMQMTAEMDAGPILSMYKFPIEKTDDFGTLSNRLSRAASVQLISTLEDIIADKAEYWEQDHAQATFTQKIESTDCAIDWRKPALMVVNHIRALSPKPGAYTEIDGLRIKILKARIEEGTVKLDIVQLPGKRPMSYSDLKNGYKAITQKLEKLVTP